MIKTTVHDVCGDSVRVYHPKKSEKGYQIAVASGGWLKGLYDSIESALLGAKYDLMLNEDFYEMQKRVNHFDREDRLITVKDFEFLECKDEQAKAS